MLRSIGRFFWRFMVIFSFIVNLVLVVVVLGLVLFIFEIKNQVAEPLVEGLHSSFVGLEQATIDWTIPVRDQIQVDLNIPLETDTVVVLTDPVPLQVGALIDLPGINAFDVAATVDLELPAGLELPVALDLDVEVDQPLDVELDVRAVIPLSETQLYDVARNLRYQLEPLAIALNNLPNDFGGAIDLTGEVLRGDADLLAPNDYSREPWPGYSMTAGLGYDLHTEPVPESNLPLQTGIVPVGGMPFLDEQVRPELYTGDSDPEAINVAARERLAQLGIDPLFFQTGLGPLMRPDPSLDMAAEPTIDEVANPVAPQTAPQDPVVTPQPPAPQPTASPPSDDQGIIMPTQPGG